MGFCIHPGEGTDAAIRRVALEQLDAAISHLRHPADPAVAVHESRKACKRVRALLRLVRPSLRSRRYELLNATVRDAAAELSSTRDAEALLTMFDDLVKAHGRDPGQPELAAVRAGLRARVASLEEDVARTRQTMGRAGERLEVAREGAAGIRLHEEGFKALEGGLAATYRRGRRAMDELIEEASPERSHEWRKAVKYTWHHLELLERLAPSVLEPAARSFHRLADALGDAHNLAVLAGELRASPAAFGGAPGTDAVIGLAETSRDDLEGRALRLGLRLYAEKPAAFTRRLHGYWRAEQRMGGELPTGELADVADDAAG